MLLTRLYLRNFRVYEDELDLALPPGLVGIFGPNGAGKSTLLEAILFTLWGKARTPKEQIRSAGVGGDCLTEIEFEHEGHLYVVRRSLSGINTTVRAEAHCDGLIMSEGVRDTGRYLHSVLGMEDGAFRASVFAEQKQLAAFSSQTPAERRRLVLQLLGITPLDGARDAARKDARSAAEEHRHLREILPDLEALIVATTDAAVAAAAAAAVALDEERALEVVRHRLAAAAETASRLDRARQEYDGLVLEGKAARTELDRAVATIDDLTAELGDLESDRDRLAELERRAADLADDEGSAAEAESVLAALDTYSSISVPVEPPIPDESAQTALDKTAGAAQQAIAVLDGQCHSALAELVRAREQAARSVTLSGEEDCPVCGQALGDAFAAVRQHRAEEVTQCRDRLETHEREREHARALARSSSRAAEQGGRQIASLLRSRQLWDEAHLRRLGAIDSLCGAVEQARRRGDVHTTELLTAPCYDQSDSGFPLPSRSAVEGWCNDLVVRVEVGRTAARDADRLRGRLERRPAVESSLAKAAERRSEAADTVARLRDKVRSLGFDPAALTSARAEEERAQLAVAGAERSARTAALEAAGASVRAEATEQRLGEARAQHAKLSDLERDVRHLSRVADLLSEFRNTVVASVGPRLAVQAAELFGELTDHEYDELQVDPDTYELQISDAGRSYGLDRFSGSEIDLANLALRVAISEHIRFQSGGSVGLLVLDEVFGPLDQDRKDRMLMALERLKGRFRQILVVTHDPNVKEQMPAAIEVVKLPGRRATARVVS